MINGEKFSVELFSGMVDVGTVLAELDNNASGVDLLLSLERNGDMVATLCDEDEHAPTGSGKVLIVWGRELVDEVYASKLSVDVREKLNYYFEGGQFQVLD